MGHDMLPQDGHHAGVAMPEAGHGAQDVLKHLPPSQLEQWRKTIVRTNYIATVFLLSTS